MIRTAILAATLAGATLVAAPVEARTSRSASLVTWHPAKGSEGRYCIRPTLTEEAAQTGVPLFQRSCRSARAWQALGLRFIHLAPGRVPIVAG